MVLALVGAVGIYVGVGICWRVSWRCELALFPDVMCWRFGDCMLAYLFGAFFRCYVWRLCGLALAPAYYGCVCVCTV